MKTKDEQRQQQIQGSLHFGRDDRVLVVRANSRFPSGMTIKRRETLVGACGGFAGFHFLEEPDDDHAEEAEEREPAKNVDEGPCGGLALKLLVEAGLRGGEGVGVSIVGGEGLLGALEEGAAVAQSALSCDASGC